LLKEIAASALMIFFDKDSIQEVWTSSYHQENRQKNGIFVKEDLNAKAATSFNKICLSEDILPNYIYIY
jgi:hypothetical protein